MYMRNSSKKRKYLIVKLFGTRSCDGSLYVCSCRYNGCINRRDVHIIRGIEHQIDLIHGATLPNHAPYRTNPEETKEIQRQIQELLDIDHIRESLSPCA